VKIGSTGLLVLLSASVASAATLRLPPQLRRAGDAIGQQCPACIAMGFMACGTRDVAYGKRFARTALQGRPLRGYLVGFVMNGDEFRRLARQADYDALTATLRDRFGQAQLVVLDAPAARVLPPPRAVTVNFPRPLHACVQDTRKPWGCCVAANCHDECCEKSLGSPSVVLEWEDARTRESLVLTFHHGAGFSQLRRRGRHGQSLYYCLVDQAAFLE
jgi:hypothetical protein